jgi:hypothetical protein
MNIDSMMIHGLFLMGVITLVRTIITAFFSTFFNRMVFDLIIPYFVRNLGLQPRVDIIPPSVV